MKRVASNTWNGVKSFASKAWNVTKSAFNHATNWISTQYNRAVNWSSRQWNKVQTAYNSASDYVQTKYQQAAAQIEARRQQVVRSAYALATGLSSSPTIREGMNLLRNWGTALQNTLKHVCTTAERVKSQVVDFVKSVDWKKVAVTAAAIGVGIALTVATGGLGAPVAMAIGGAASGAIISGYDAYSSGQRGWELVGSIAKGAGTGAISGLIGGQLVGAGASLATNVTQSISNQAVRQVAKIGVESAVETAIDTGIDLATGNKITGQTVAMNFAFNTFTNGAGSVSPKKAPKADVVTTKPKSGDVEVLDVGYKHHQSLKDVTPPAEASQKLLDGPRAGTPSLEVLKENTQVGTYKKQTKSLKGTDYQAHHVNQAAMMKKTAPNYSYNDGVTVPLIGNIRKDIGSPHYNAHATMEEFYNQYRKGGSKYGDIPTISDYNDATTKSLKDAGLTDSQVGEVMSATRAEQSYYGLNSDSEIILPGRMPLPKKK